MEFNKKHTQMIKNFHLKKIILNKIFCFNHLEVEFNKINIIFSGNGLGKTYLLRAIDLAISHHLDQKELFFTTIYRMLCNLNRFNNSDLELQFAESQFAESQGKKYSKQISYYHKDDDFDIKYIFDNINYTTITKTEISKIIGKLIEVLYRTIQISDKHYNGIKDNSFSEFILYVEGEKYWQNAIGHMQKLDSENINFQEDMLKASRIFKPETSAIRFGPNGINFFQENLQSPMNIGSQGYGFKRFLTFLYMIIANKNKLACIDEAENGLHFNNYQETIKTIITTAKIHDTQLFITTHSREYAIALAEAIKEADMQPKTSFFNIARKLGSYENLMLEVNRYDDLDSILHGLQSFQDFFRMV